MTLLVIKYYYALNIASNLTTTWFIEYFIRCGIILTVYYL